MGMPGVHSAGVVRDKTMQFRLCNQSPIRLGRTMWSRHDLEKPARFRTHLKFDVVEINLPTGKNAELVLMWLKGRVKSSRAWSMMILSRCSVQKRCHEQLSET